MSGKEQHNQLADVPVSHDAVKPEDFSIQVNGSQKQSRYSRDPFGQSDGDVGDHLAPITGRGNDVNPRRQFESDKVAKGRGIINRKGQ